LIPSYQQSSLSNFPRVKYLQFCFFAVIFESSIPKDSIQVNAFTPHMLKAKSDQLLSEEFLNS